MLEIPAKKVSPYADQSPISIKHDASLQQAIEVASSFVGESIPVINRSNGELLGIVTEADLFQLYLSLQHRVADEADIAQRVVPGWLSGQNIS